MKRIALLADIHGNPLALDAVLSHIQAQGDVDGYWILGDLCAFGYDPVSVLERLATLPNAVFIRGNADRFVATNDYPHPTQEEARKNPDLIPALVEAVSSFAWTRGYLEARGWLDWLKALPLDHRLTLPDGTRVLLVHASPGTDEGPGLHPGLSDEQVRQAIEGCNADLICVGHFHVPMERKLDGIRFVNPGSISNSHARDLRPAYAVISASAAGYQFTYYHVDYEHQAAIDASARSSNPGIPYILQCLEGSAHFDWHDGWDGVSYLPVTET